MACITLHSQCPSKSVKQSSLLFADASLNRVQSLIAKASLLGVDQQRLAQARQACISRNEAATIALQLAVDAQPFSADIFRVRSLDAKRLGLNSEADSAQGELYSVAVALALHGSGLGTFIQLSGTRLLV